MGLYLVPKTNATETYIAEIYAGFTHRADLSDFWTCVDPLTEPICDLSCVCLVALLPKTFI
jgi:hypothetical protein